MYMCSVVDEDMLCHDRFFQECEGMLVELPGVFGGEIRNRRVPRAAVGNLRMAQKILSQARCHIATLLHDVDIVGCKLLY